MDDVVEGAEYIYVIALENGKYYVGRSKDPERRFREHKSSDNQWLRENKPLRIIEVKQLSGLFDEDNKTKAYMYTHGIDNVRGGTYTTLVLKPEVRALLEKELVHTFNLCFRCMQPGHYAGNCPNG